MANYREIVTKAVVSKCKKKSETSYEIECEQIPNTVLGCWVINNTFNGANSNGKVVLNGSFDINVWYSYDNDTKTAVVTRNFKYHDILNVNLKNGNKLDKNDEIMVECLKQPTVIDVKIKGGIVSLKVEKELGVEIIGRTTVKVAIEEDTDDYEEIFDTEEEKEVNINIDDLSDDYLKKDSVNN